MKENEAGRRGVEWLLRPGLIAGMLACLATPAVVLVQLVLPGWDGRYFLVFAFFASLEGVLSERILARQRITGWAYLGSRATEAVLLLLLLKLAGYVPLGLVALLADAQVWVSDPYRFFADLDLLLSALFLILWTGSLMVGRLAMALDTDQVSAEPPADKSSIEYYLWLTQPSIARDRQQNLDRLAEFMLWGGIAMLVLAAAVHLTLTSAGALAMPMLLYFALGIALLSQARFSVNHAGWQSQGIPVQPGIARRWLRWVVLFLLGVALVSLALPTYYSRRPLQAFLALASVLFLVLQYVLALLIFLLTRLLAPLVPGAEPGPPPALDLQAFEPADVIESGSAGPAWADTALSALFWIVVLAILSYALYRFWQDRRAALAGGAGSAWWQRLLAWLKSLAQSWLGWTTVAQDRLARRRAQRREDRQLPQLSRFFFPGRLRPRQMIRYFYLSSERRAAAAGKPRAIGETPFEYRASLDRSFPELEPDLEGLTEAFVAARYSRAPVLKEEADTVKPLWQRIRAALRRRSAGS